MFRYFCQMSLWYTKVSCQAFHECQRLVLTVTLSFYKESIFEGLTFFFVIHLGMICCQSASGPHPDRWQPILTKSTFGVCLNLWGGFVHLPLEDGSQIHKGLGSFQAMGPKFPCFKYILKIIFVFNSLFTFS